MFDYTYVPILRIAKTKARHSWALPLLRLSERRWARAEWLMLRWIDREMPRAIPGASPTAASLAKGCWLNVLERAAIRKLMRTDEYFFDELEEAQRVCQENMEHEAWKRLAVVRDAADAVGRVARELGGPPPERDKGDAVAFLKMMESGERKPDVDGFKEATKLRGARLTVEDLFPDGTDSPCGSLLDIPFIRDLGPDRGGKLARVFTDMGFGLVEAGFRDHDGWSCLVREIIGDISLAVIEIPEDQIEDLARSLWNAPKSVGGTTMKIRQWAERRKWEEHPPWKS